MAARESFINSAGDFLQWESISRDTIDFKRIYIDITGYDPFTETFEKGDLISGLLLSQIVYWFLPDKNRTLPKAAIEREGKLWLAKKRDDWWEECRMTPKQFVRASDILKNAGLIDIAIFKFDGNPTTHIHLNVDHLIRLIKTFQTKGTVGSVPKGQNQRDERDISRGTKGTFLLTESTTEITSETTTESMRAESALPLPFQPPHGLSLPSSAGQAEDRSVGKEEPTADRQDVPEQPVKRKPGYIVDPETYHLDLEEFVDLYNALRPEELPEVRTITESRRKRYKQYLRQFPLMSYWQRIFFELSSCPLLLGQCPTPGHESFRASLDWLCQRGKDGIENCQKVFELKYRPKEVDRHERFFDAHSWDVPADHPLMRDTA